MLNKSTAPSSRSCSGRATKKKNASKFECGCMKSGASRWFEKIRTALLVWSIFKSLYQELLEFFV